jgi:hypothetical protein
MNDVYLFTGGGVYPTGMKESLPSDRSGYVSSLTCGEGWLFAAITSNGYSSVMKYSLDNRSWSEQFRGLSGRKIQNITWQDCSETRARLWAEMGGEIVFQEFPLNGIRPFDDSGQKYQHEAVLILPTIDLLTTDPKYYATLSVTSQGLSQDSDTETGHEIVVEYQKDNDVGSSTWYHVGYIRTSPSGDVDINIGNTRMLRLRLRLVSNEASDPVIVETIGISLFSRNKLAHQWQIYFRTDGSDDEQNGFELLKWLRDAYTKAEPLRMLSRFRLYHDRRVTLVDEPFYRIEEVDPDADEIEAPISITIQEVL